MISQNQDYTLHKGDSIEYEGAVWTVSGFEQEIDVWSSDPDKIEYKTTVLLTKTYSELQTKRIDVEDLLY